MRSYAAALVVLAGLYGAPTVAADLPTKKPAPEEIVAPVLPSTWRYEITGYGWGMDLAGQAGGDHFPPHRCISISSSSSNTSREG